MDHIVIKTDKLTKLTNVSVLSSQLLIEVSRYIQLAVAAEQYVNSGVMDDFYEMNNTLSECAQAYPTFRQTYDSLSALLISMGYIGVAGSTPPDITKTINKTESPKPHSPKNNVVSLFSQQHTPPT